MTDHKYEGAEAVFNVPLDEEVRIAMKGRYQVATMFVEADGQVTLCSEDSWTVPRSRVLQFASLIRYIASGEINWDIQPAPTAAQIIGMAEAWALRQGLFQEVDSTSVG